jgi:hypothetical protein
LHRCSTAIWFPLPYAHPLLIFGRDKEHRLGPRPQTPSTCRPLAEGNGEPVPLLEDCPSLAYHHAITSIHTSRSANLLTTTCIPTRLSPEPRQVEDRAAVQAPSCPDKASGKGRKRAATLCAFLVADIGRPVSGPEPSAKSRQRLTTLVRTAPSPPS